MAAILGTGAEIAPIIQRVGIYRVRQNLHLENSAMSAEARTIAAIVGKFKYIFIIFYSVYFVHAIQFLFGVKTYYMFIIVLFYR